jgi:hydrogenase expression/formation protein HypC
VIEVDGPVASVDFWGVRRQIRLDLVDAPVAPGDYILNHVGYAIRRIPESEIGATLELYEMLLREADEDLMAGDVRGEIAGAGNGAAAEIVVSAASAATQGPAPVRHGRDRGPGEAT